MDIIRIPRICGKDDQLMVSWKDRIEVWKEYEESLLYNESKWSGMFSNLGQIEGPCEKVAEGMVEEALGRLKTEKAAGPTAVTVDLFKVVDKDCIKRLMDVANGLLGGARMPESWRRSDLLPLYKRKGDLIRSCGSYRSVKLIERIYEECLRKNVKLDEMQIEFVPGKDTTDAIFLVHQMHRWAVLRYFFSSGAVGTLDKKYRYRSAGTFIFQFLGSTRYFCKIFYNK